MWWSHVRTTVRLQYNALKTNSKTLLNLLIEFLSIFVYRPDSFTKCCGGWLVYSEQRR